MEQKTRINVRAVIQQDGKMLLCHFTDKAYYFLPGGGVEFAEATEDALRRELREELGVNLTSAKFIGAVENLFDNKGAPYHELNLVFAVQIDNPNPVSQEDHIGFAWLPNGDLERENILPKHLTAAVVQWMTDSKTFWAGMDA